LIFGILCALNITHEVSVKAPGSAKNRLAKEKSPYLLQHASNPVDWYPWGSEAFDKARNESKLIFLSIGYSTCHWCHVMEHESFENEEVAAILNHDFVSIKVDREERPDIDHIYMTAVQTMTGAGGWPLSLFLTPEGKPITGGTYFPPIDRWGRPGMKTILPRLAKLWKENRADAEKAANEMAGLLQVKPDVDGATLDASIFDKALTQYRNGFDPERGGFGGAPKFPRSHDLSFLMGLFHRTRNEDALKMVEVTLQHMAHGGIYDHLGGGFHRYATDENWLVPHFEKMLYDQAMLVKTYLEAFQLTRNSFYADVARDILNYVSRDMTDPAGGFYSAEDADSEGEEGKFYVWQPQETLSILGEEKGQLFNSFYGVTPEGNFEHKTSILNITKPLESFARDTGKDPAYIKKLLLECHCKLFGERAKRIAPYKDDKVLTAWNGLMITSYARAAQILGESRYADQARRAADFVLTHLQKDGRLLRRYREGEAAVLGFHDDYAFFALGLLDLYEATFEVKWLEEATRLTREMIRLFWDDQDGGFFYTAQDAEVLIARSKDYYDGATPSGNSIATLLMLRLSRMIGDTDLEARAEKAIQSNAAPADHYPMAFPQFLMAVDFALGPTREIVFAGEKSSAFNEMIAALHATFDPRRVVLHYSEGTEGERIGKLAPYLMGQKSLKGLTTAYICENHACDLPITDPAEFKNKIITNE
jgi:uncharacterized protein